MRFFVICLIVTVATLQDNGVICDDVKTNSSTIIVLLNTTSTVAPVVTNLPNLCTVCTCTGDNVDCANRQLTNHFAPSQWPKGPLNEVSFVGNQLIHLNPFPEVSIKKLILRKNQIASINNTAFKLLYNLTELDLSHNQLTSRMLLPGVFEGRFLAESFEPLNKLTILNLATNALHVLHQDLFEHLPNVKILNLSGNPLHVINDQTVIAISGLLYLEELDLSYCNLDSIPIHMFHATRYLRKLDLSGNRLTVVPRALDDAKKLEIIYLDENPIKTINAHNGFPILPKLREVSLCCMPHLHQVDFGAFSQLQNLESMRLQNCPLLEEIDESAFVNRSSSMAVWPPLKKLNLSDNALRYLPSMLVGRWDNLEELDLMNNEWSCDCDNQYLIGELLPEFGKKLMGENLEELKCASPVEHAGKTLTSLSNRKLRCLDMYNARPEKDAAVLIGILIGLLLAIPIGMAIFVFWRRGFLFCGPQGPASFSRAFYKRTSNDDVDI